MADDTGEIGREAAEAVGFENIKTGGGQSAYWQSQAMANWVAHNQSMLLRFQHAADTSAAIHGKIAELIMSTSPSEGGADTAALAALAKIIQGTPPPTNLPTQGQ